MHYAEKTFHVVGDYDTYILVGHSGWTVLYERQEVAVFDISSPNISHITVGRIHLFNRKSAGLLESCRWLADGQVVLTVCYCASVRPYNIDLLFLKVTRLFLLLKFLYQGAGTTVLQKWIILTICLEFQTTWTSNHVGSISIALDIFDNCVLIFYESMY